MRPKIIIFIICSVLLQFCDNAFSSPTTEDKAAKVVIGWLKSDSNPLETRLGRQVDYVETYDDNDGNSLYYAVYLRPSGFVIVPADNSVEPIIAFADDGTYDPSFENPLGALVSRDVEERVVAARKTETLLYSATLAQIPASQSKWRRLEELGNEASGRVLLMGLSNCSDIVVPPLLQTKWSQEECCTSPYLSCYNYYVPPFGVDDPYNYPCGCTATAMAQLMRYREYPTDGIGVQAFTIKVDDANETAYTRGGDGMGGPYEWDLMVSEPDCSTTEAERQAIGALCYDAGVSAKIAYASRGTGGSSANISDVRDALINVFKYSNAVYAYNYDWNQQKFQDIGQGLNDMINPNLDANYPVILAVGNPDDPNGGHAILADGYGYNLSTLYHHINMGWGGMDDAWYNLPTVDSTVSFEGLAECVYNIFTQGSGEIISGRVTDTFGIPISDALVKVYGSNVSYTATTNSKGIYALAKVEPEKAYTITVTKAGYDFESQVVKTGTSINSTPATGNIWGINFQGNDMICPAGSPWLHPEPDTTPGLCNTIQWDPVLGVVKYYAECANDADFADIIANSGWTNKTSCTFIDLNTGQRYWYRVKDRPGRTWSQTGKLDFECDAMVDTVTIDDGDVVLSVGSMEVYVINDPSHEAGTGWVSEPFSIDLYAYQGNFWTPDGDYAFDICFDYGYYHTAGDYACFRQTVDWTGVDTLKFDYCTWYGEQLILKVLVGGTEVWSAKVTGLYQDEHFNVTADVSAFSGPEVLELRVEATESGVYGGDVSFDNLRTYGPGGYVPEGSIISIPIDLPNDADWKWDTMDVNFTNAVNANITVDILPATGSIPISGYENIRSGADLSGINESTVRLRANLVTDDTTITPALHDWSVTYANHPCESGWSNVESSLQCGTE